MLIALTIACSERSPSDPIDPIEPDAPIDPVDPLIGAFEGGYFERWSFDADGTYSHRYRGRDETNQTVDIVEDGSWHRVDEITISLCRASCETPEDRVAWLEEPYLLIDPAIAVDGTWRWSESQPCFAHGTENPGSWQRSLIAGGHVTESYSCNALGPTGWSCTGTWTSIPLGVHVEMLMTCGYQPPRSYDLFRLSDAIGTPLMRTE